MEELERTFLAKRLPSKLASFPLEEMLDIYIPLNSPHPTLRIRRQGNIYQITKKAPISNSDSSHQIENTIPLTADEHRELSKIKGKRVAKTRYHYKESGTNYEIDIFHGDLEGLVLVDVEFLIIEEKNNFILPDFCLAEVTQEEFIAGGMLWKKLPRYSKRVRKIWLQKTLLKSEKID